MFYPKWWKTALTLERTGRNLRLAVQNTAEGLTQESLEHIFARFYRGDASHNSDRVAGHGIGLPIAQMIVNAHKGKIIASIQDGSSLLITVTLPL